jgi:chloramphenicol-sensitive protein RarD
MGFIQYFTPLLQLLVGVVLFREPMPLERWIGFGLVWVALVVFTVDMVLAVRRDRRAGAAETDATDAVTSDPLPE